MNDFKEWLSDYLRYFMLAAAFLLLFGIILVGTNVYRSMQQKDDQEVIQILTETEQESETDDGSEATAEVSSEDNTEETEDGMVIVKPVQTEMRLIIPGFRPVVCLKSDTVLEKQSEGIYRIK